MLTEIAQLEGAAAVDSLGEDMVERLQRVKEYRQQMTAEEMHAILEQRDLVRVKVRIWFLK